MKDSGNFKNQAISMLILVALICFLIPPTTRSLATTLEEDISRADHSRLIPQRLSEELLSRDSQSFSSRATDRELRARIDQKYGKLPLGFEANRGQADHRVKFISRSGSAALFLTSNQAVLALRRPAGKKDRHKDLTSHRSIEAQTKANIVSTLRVSMIGANPAARVEGVDQLPGVSNYLMGKDPSKWRVNISTYAKVQYQDLYPGVNLIYYGNDRQLEYDFVVAPGANPNLIKMAFEGAQRIWVDASGALVLKTASGNVLMRKPSVYQETNGMKQPLAGRYVLKGKRQVGFEVLEYDSSKVLVIDPVLSYSTFLGGNNLDEGRAIAVDSAGNAYVTGRTFSFNFPTTIDAFSTTYKNSSDVFVTKMNADGTAIVYSTFLGGNSDDFSNGVAVDSVGNAYVTGFTASTDYPITPGAFQVTLTGSSFSGEVFATKLNSTGTALVYSTYLGGSNSDQGNSIAVDLSGNAFIAGSTNSTNFPTTIGAFRTSLSSSNDAFVTKVNSTGTALVYSTYVGGSNADQANGIALDSSGNAFITGVTSSTNFPVSVGAYQTALAPPSDAFVTKLNDSGTNLVYSTYLGTDATGSSIAVSSSGEAYVTGFTNSNKFPTTPGVARVGNGGAAKSTNSGAGWTAINTGLTNASINSLAIDPSNPTTVFAATAGGGIFKSTNGGDNWIAINSGLTDLIIKTIIVDSANSSLLYLGTNNRGVFRSTNGGSTWKAINTGQNGMTVSALTIDPGNHSIIYAGTDQGVFKTTNGGANWAGANVGLNQSIFINVLAIDPVATSTIYAGLNFAGIYMSTNGGSTWNPTGQTNTNIRSLVIDPSMTSTLYAATNNGALKSTDGGISWSGINKGLTNRTVNVLVISPADSSTIYAGTGNGVFKTINAGGDWAAVNSGLTGAVVNTLAIDPSNPVIIYSGASTGSTDAFVAKMNTTGDALIYSTLLGGSSSDLAAGIAIDSLGNAYVTGQTSSSNFPTTPPLFQNISSFSTDAFVTKLNTTATGFVYSTFLGGSSFDQAFGIAVDSSNSAYVTGITQSQNFPITAEAFQASLGGFSADAFITKLVPVPTLSSDLKIEMTAPASSSASSGFSYSITVTNMGPEPASSVIVSDDLPSSLLFSFCNSQTFSCNNAGNSVTFTLTSLEVGASHTMSIFVNVSCSIPSTAIIPNTVAVESSATDPDTSNNSAMVTTTATNPETTLSPQSQSVPSGSSTSNFISVNRGVNCAWTATSNASWITITSSTNCCNGSVFYNVAANTGVARTGTMTIAGKTFTVNQAGVCTATILPTAAGQGSSGGIGSTNVTAPIGCTWTASSNDSWITIDSGSSGSGNGTVNYSVAANPGANRTGTMSIANNVFTVTQQGILGNSPFDFDSDGKTDVSVWRPSSGNWYIINSFSGSVTLRQLGMAGDKPVAGDYDADGKADIAVWRPSTGVWNIILSATDTNTGLEWGMSGDIPVPADYDGDGKTDVAIWRPSGGLWYIIKSSTGAVTVQQWGQSGDVPVVGDYDADSKADIAVWRPASGTWLIILSSTGTSTGLTWGESADVAVPQDYDGDGKTDVAIWRPSSGLWYVINSSTGLVSVQVWGQSGDQPVPGDYDADGKADLAVWRPSDGNWFIILSSTSTSTGLQWGMTGDVPVPMF